MAIFSGHRSIGEHAAGKGLGLHIVMTLIDDYRGMPHAGDRIPGDHLHGCRFVIELPAAGE
jgi:K+-sensing histidine kinase KdpD